MLREFQHWGDVYKVKFTLNVTRVPIITSDWLNAFQFTATNNITNNIPALDINMAEESFRICTIIDGKDECLKHELDEFYEPHEMTIQQTKYDNGEYWFEMIVDRIIIHREENKQPKIFPNVILYASNPWQMSFSPKMGSVSWFEMRSEYLNIGLTK